MGFKLFVKFFSLLFACFRNTPVHLHQLKRKFETMKQAIATAIEYTETQKAWAVAMYRDNVPSSEVERKTGVKAGYVRTLSRRLGKDIEKVEAVAIEPVSVVSPAETPAQIVSEKRETRRFSVTILDVVFYSTTLTACAGIVTALKWWGLPVSLVYSLILVDSMNKAKDVTLENAARMGAVMVVIFELIAACVHTYFFNSILWANYKALPFDMREKIIDGVYSFPNSDKPFLIAAGIAAVLSGSAIYAIENSILTARERAKVKAQ